MADQASSIYKLSPVLASVRRSAGHRRGQVEPPVVAVHGGTGRVLEVDGTDQLEAEPPADRFGRPVVDRRVGVHEPRLTLGAGDRDHPCGGGPGQSPALELRRQRPADLEQPPVLPLAVPVADPARAPWFDPYGDVIAGHRSESVAAPLGR